MLKIDYFKRYFNLCNISCTKKQDNILIKKTFILFLNLSYAIICKLKTKISFKLIYFQ